MVLYDLLVCFKGGSGCSELDKADDDDAGEGQEDAMSKDPELNLAQRLIKVGG